MQKQKQSFVKAKAKPKQVEKVIALELWKSEALLKAKLRHPSNQKLS